MTIQAFRSRADDTTRRFGTFSYLPPLTRDQVARQVEHIIAQGWTCVLEHVEPARATVTYWYLWKLPLFGATGAAEVLSEFDACRQAHPDHLIRLTGHDRRRQTQGLAVVVHGGEPQ